MEEGKLFDAAGDALEVSNAKEPLLVEFDGSAILDQALQESDLDLDLENAQDATTVRNAGVAQSMAETGIHGPSSRDCTLPLVGIKISYDMTPFSSTLSSLHPVCRICHNSGEKSNVLLTPCRCDGTLKYVHGTCLRRWIEMRLRRKKYECPHNCELCGYLYRKRKFIKCIKWKMPRVSLRDKILHFLFFLCLIAMVTCTIVTIQHLINDSNTGGVQKYKTGDVRSSLSNTELITLSCGVIFFITFMFAVTVEIKARHTIYDIFRKLIRYNTVWVIENYKSHSKG